MTQELGGRKGSVFALRVTDAERAELERRWKATHLGPRALGPWILWTALGSTRAGGRRVIPDQVPSSGNTGSSAGAAVIPRRRRVILDLCAGTGAWSEPYRRAGYRVVRVTWPRHDVCTYVPPRRVWGVVAAPPCDQFSLARNGSKTPRDFAAGMACVNACMRIVAQCAPRWWALENPQGLLAKFLGTPAFVFEPCDFGDPWTKRTALWGSFTAPSKGPYVKPAAGKLRLESSKTERARTPPGFARAFYEANP